jgi:hypothetical protein
MTTQLNNAEEICFYHGYVGFGPAEVIGAPNQNHSLILLQSFLVVASLHAWWFGLAISLAWEY